MSVYVHFGCGMTAPNEWINYDVSPTLRIQKVPLIGWYIRKRSSIRFPSNVRYGDIIKGLPGIEKGTCDLIYCSHVLEHLCLQDFKLALENTFTLLKPGGVFRCVIPDLELYVKNYLERINSGDQLASCQFMKDAHIGLESRPKSIKEIIVNQFGNSRHLWMWDKNSLKFELVNAGFSSVRRCFYDDSKYKMFRKVENRARFRNAIAFESIK